MLYSSYQTPYTPFLKYFSTNTQKSVERNKAFYNLLSVHHSIIHFAIPERRPVITNRPY